MLSMRPIQTRPVSPLALTAQSKNMGVSPTLAINELVAQKKAEGRRILHLGFGQASFPLHPKLSAALKQSARQTDYAPVSGILPLRSAIRDYLEWTRKVSCTREDIIVAPGSKPLLYALLQVLRGDLLLPVPSWVSYAPQARLTGKKIIAVHTDPLDRLKITTAALTEALEQGLRSGAQPRILLINSPNNPTGGMLAEENVKAIAVWARANGITLISDEIYAETAHGWRPHVSPAQFYPEGTIVTGGISKSLSAGGWRLGYAALPEGRWQLRQALQAVASEIWSAAATPVQNAAVAAFTPDKSIEDYIKAASFLHGHLTSRLQEAITRLGISCPRPAGGFYLYPDFEPWRKELAAHGVKTSNDLALYLLDKYDIASLPGTNFGERPDALCLRLSTSMLYDDGDTASGAQAIAFQDVLSEIERGTNPGDIVAPTCPALEDVSFRLFQLIGGIAL